jgi:hypothetical protein
LIESLDRGSFETIAPELLEHLNPRKSHDLAWDLASRMCLEPGFDIDAFARLLREATREQRAHRAARIASAGLGLDVGLEVAVRLLAEPSPCWLRTQRLIELAKMPTRFGDACRIVRDLAEPQSFSCRLTTQELVELLKMPTCYGPARRVVLDHLGNRYHRHFVNHWAFVRFATDQELGLDFTTPPRRPDRKARSPRPAR